MGCPNTLLAAESTGDSTVLDNLSINGLLAQYVQKRADYRLVIQPVCSLRLHTTFFCGSINIQNKYQTKISTDNRVFLQSVLNFLCVSDIEFILCIGYLFCPYPHRSKAFNILVSVQSAFNISTGILTTCISG